MACCEGSTTLCPAPPGCPSPTLRLAFCTLFTLFTSSRSSSCFRILLILGCGRLVRCFMSRVQMPAGVAARSAVSGEKRRNVPQRSTVPHILTPPCAWQHAAACSRGPRSPALPGGWQQPVPSGPPALTHVAGGLDALIHQHVLRIQVLEPAGTMVSMELTECCVCAPRIGLLHCPAAPRLLLVTAAPHRAASPIELAL